MKESPDFIERIYRDAKRFLTVRAMIGITVGASIVYFIQYSFLNSAPSPYFFPTELIRNIVPFLLIIICIHKYRASKLPGWAILCISSVLFFIARTIETLIQVSVALREWLPVDYNLLYVPLYPFAIVGILSIGLHKQSLMTKTRVIFSSVTLAASLAFVATSQLIVHGSQNASNGLTTNVFIDVFILAFAFSITVFCGLDRVILPLTIALFLNALADIFVFIFPSDHPPMLHPLPLTITLASYIAFTTLILSEENEPRISITSHGEDILHYFIHAIAFLSLIYAGSLYLTNEELPQILFVMISGVFIALLGEQLVTYHYNKLLIRKSDLDLTIAQASEEKFRIAFENGPTTLVLLDEEGHILRANKAFFRFTAFEEVDVVGSALSYIIHPDDRAIFDVNLATVLSELSGHSINVECRFLRRDGSVHWGSASISHIPLSFVGQEDPAEFVVQIEDITDQKVHETELKSLAAKDPLTGLWNRTHMFELITEVVEESQAQDEDDINTTFAVMFLDLDRFKIINDTLGHAAGDVVLNITSERITSIVGIRGEVARIGGDEFVILLAPPTTETVASLIAQEIKETLCQPILLSQGETIITCSIGVVMCTGSNLTAQDILRDADSAMYRAKEQGKNSIEISFSKDRQQISTELRFSNDLHRALATEQIRVFYQPIVSLDTNEIIGFEALSRWIHPKKGIISPDEFIPLAEDTGLILDIGYYMMQESFKQLALWQKDYVTSSGRPLSMNVNLSVTQLRDPKLLREIERIKNQSNCTPHSMAFEITESAVLGDSKRAISLLNDIRDLGFRLRVDDFGTGYSSLSYLKKLPIDGFKIDKSFVDGLDIDEDDTAIIHALLGLAHAMHLTVTAEGIEQDSQRIALKALGCDYGQGYLFSAGIPAEDVVLPNRSHHPKMKNRRDSA